MPEADRPIDDYDVWAACSHSYRVSHWGFPVVAYTCTKCGGYDERDVS